MRVDELTDDEQYELEKLVDKYTFSGVLFHLSRVAALKGRHIIDTWQSPALAAVWQSCAGRVERMAEKIKAKHKDSGL